MSDAQRQTRQHRGTVSVQEAADLLGVTRRTVHRWQAQGRMPPRVVYGRRPQYRRLDIFDMLQAAEFPDTELAAETDRRRQAGCHQPPPSTTPADRKRLSPTSHSPSESA